MSTQNIQHQNYDIYQYDDLGGQQIIRYIYFHRKKTSFKSILQQKIKNYTNLYNLGGNWTSLRITNSPSLLTNTKHEVAAPQLIPPTLI